MVKRKNPKEGEAEYIHKGTHSHDPDVRNKLAAQTMHSLKEAAKTSKDKARNLVSDSVQTVDGAVASVLPSLKSMTRMVNRVRSKENIIVNPRNLSELKLDNVLTEKDVPFLLYDNESVDERLLIFATRSNLEILASADGIFADGTFSVTPHLFHQLYTVHGTFFYSYNLVSIKWHHTVRINHIEFVNNRSL